MLKKLIYIVLFILGVMLFNWCFSIGVNYGTFSKPHNSIHLKNLKFEKIDSNRKLMFQGINPDFVKYIKDKFSIY